MPLDIFSPKGSTKASRPDAGNANLRTVPVFGIVKDNVDPIRSGRIQVYIDDLGGTDPDDSSAWMTVNYLPPFYGYTDASGGDTNYGDFTANPASYGMWFSPPDIGTKVICIFINGDPNYGFYLGAVPKPEALRMIPAIGANFDKEKVIFNESEAMKYGGVTRLPVTNMNTNNDGLTNDPQFLIAPKPVHSYTASTMMQQGIIRDPIRGPIGTSSQRESPSRVGWGVNTPGRPIFEGGYTDETIAGAVDANGGSPTNFKLIGRRGGHSIIMDDGDLIGNDQLIRIRTALGHQIMLSDNGQTLSILHANGQSYIELGKEGTIDMFSTNSVNVRTQGDLNLHADNDININAKKNLNVFAEQINVESTKDYNQKVGTSSSIYTMGKHTHKVDGAMSMASDGDASYASTSTTFINGSRINLNTGETGTTPEKVQSLKQIAQTDTLYDSEKGFLAAPGKLLTVASRAPAHYPWANAGQGVDVKTSLDAASELPNSPNDSVASANENAGPVDADAAVTQQGVATVPPVDAVSSAIDKPTTGALVGAVAQGAASGPAAAAVAAGSGIVSDAKGQLTAAVGTTGLNPKQLEASGILKPGSATTVNGLIQQGANLSQAMSSNMFTGKDGAKDLTSLVNNVQAQANATVGLMQKSQTALTNAGAMTGKEGAGAVAGMVMSGATQGVGATLDAVKNAGTNVAGAAAAAVGSATDGVNKALGAGNFAAGLAQSGLNGLAGIGASVTKTFAGLADTAKGVAASAFNAIKNSFKPFEAGKPQDLGAIAAANKGIAGAANAIGGVAKTALGGALGGITSAAGGLTSGINALANTNATTLASGVTNAVGGITQAGSAAFGGAIAGVTSAAGALSKGVSAISTSVSSASSVASGVSNLAGGQNAVASVTNLATNAVNSIPGTGVAKSLIDNATTAATNGISSASAALSQLPDGSALAAQAGGALQSAQNAVGNLANDLKSKAQGLTSLASAGLPADAAAQLQSQIASISSVGEQQISLPSVAVNTTDRSALSSGLTSVLGNKKIPTPNYSGEVSASAKSEVQQQQDKVIANLQEITNLKKELKVAIAEVNAKTAAFREKESTLPSGDAGIEEARNEVKVAYEKATDISKRLREAFAA